MGRVILCTGERAANPYIFSGSGIRIYSMEELCYYIYQNIEWIEEELYHNELAAFIRDELKLPDRADFIQSLQKKKAGMKDIVVSILCSADYYSENEIKKLLVKIDLVSQLSQIQRLKRNADLLLEGGYYLEAVKEYRMILNSRELGSLTAEECGNVLHNSAVIHAFSGLFSEAANLYREAYERNHNKESLKQYLFALRLTGQESTYEKEIMQNVGSRSLIDEIEYMYRLAEQSFVLTRESAGLLELSGMKRQNQEEGYQQRVKETIAKLKESYRNKFMERTISNGAFFIQKEKEE